jgi:aspartokinase
VFYIDEDIAEKAHSLLHDVIEEDRETFTNITLRGGMGELRLRSPEFIDRPGAIGDLVRALAHRKVNIIEVVTSLSDIHIYVPWDDLEAAYECMLKFFKSKY